ncbi:MAG: hypothetical protein GKS02_13815 [Alphaproteobacteria bacterium]|nr:hypothetical protein [Alphaproteobacteria bacterium]
MTVFLKFSFGGVSPMLGKVFLSAAASLFLAVILLSPQPAAAADQIGTVKTSAGDAKIIRAGRPGPAAVGTAIEQNDIVVTGADGSVGVTFSDSSMFSVGPNTEIVVDKYVFDPNAGNGSFTANMAKGTLQFISGEISKLSPDAVRVNIPTGTIAVRGTRFLVEVGKPSL